MLKIENYVQHNTKNDNALTKSILKIERIVTRKLDDKTKMIDLKLIYLQLKSIQFFRGLRKNSSLLKRR